MLCDYGVYIPITRWYIIKIRKLKYLEYKFITDMSSSDNNMNQQASTGAFITLYFHRYETCLLKLISISLIQH